MTFVVLLTCICVAAIALRRRPDLAVDRVAAFDAFLGTPTPRLRRYLPGDPIIAAWTFQRIGRVAILSKMTACDEVTRGPFYTARDFGDEDDGGRA